MSVLVLSGEIKARARLASKKSLSKNIFVCEYSETLPLNKALS